MSKAAWAIGALILIAITGKKSTTPAESGSGTVTDPATNLTAKFIADVSQGLTVTFTPTVFGGTSPYSYSWSFGDSNATSNNSVDQNPLHVYSAPGDYAVTLAVKDSAGITVNIKATVTVFRKAIISIPGVGIYNQIIYQNGVAYRDNGYQFMGYVYHTIIRIITKADNLGYTNNGMYAGTPESPKTGLSLNSPFPVGSDADCLKRVAALALNEAGMVSYPYKGSLKRDVTRFGEVQIRSVWPNPYYTTDDKSFADRTTAQAHQDELNKAAGIIPHHILTLTATDGKIFTVDSASVGGDPVRDFFAQLAISSEANKYQGELNKIMSIGTPGPSDTVLLSMNPVGGPEEWGWHADGKVYYNGRPRAWMTLSDDKKSFVLNEW